MPVAMLLNIKDTFMLTLIAGNGCPNLARKIADKLHEPLADTHLSLFNDGEIRFELKQHVRGDDVYIIQSTCAPVNNNLMELAIMADTVKRSASHRIIAVIPYTGYSRQDRRPDRNRTPITAKLAATLLEASGIDYVVTIDIHSEQQQGFYDVPFVNLSAESLFIEDILLNYSNYNLVAVSPDVGGVKRTRAIAKRLHDAPLAIIDKRRPEPGKAKVHHIVGDVEGKTCVLIDDLVDSAGTLCEASHALKDNGARDILAYITHPVLSGNAADNIANSALSEIIVTDTIPLIENAESLMKENGRLRVLSTASLFSEAIHRIYNNKSISELYLDNNEENEER